MDELFPGIFKLLPSKPKDSKYISFFVRRLEGNVLVPCFSAHSTIDAHFDAITAQGGLTRQLLTDSHFKTPYCDEVAQRFNAPLYCSEREAPDVVPKLKQVTTFPFTRHTLEPGIEVVPTPGHRPGGVCYLITLHHRKYLFSGDFIWHNSQGWNAFPTKAGYKQILQSLETVAAIEFDVLLANTTVGDPTCYVELNATNRRPFIDAIAQRLKLPS